MTLADPELAGQGWACGMRNAEVQVPRDIDSGQPSTLRSLPMMLPGSSLTRAQNTHELTYNCINGYWFPKRAIPNLH